MEAAEERILPMFLLRVCRSACLSVWCVGGWVEDRCVWCGCVVRVSCSCVSAWCDFPSPFFVRDPGGCGGWNARHSQKCQHGSTRISLILHFFRFCSILDIILGSPVTFLDSLPLPPLCVRWDGSLAHVSLWHTHTHTAHMCSPLASLACALLLHTILATLEPTLLRFSQHTQKHLHTFHSHHLKTHTPTPLPIHGLVWLDGAGGNGMRLHMHEDKEGGIVNAGDACGDGGGYRPSASRPPPCAPVLRFHEGKRTGTPPPLFLRASACNKLARESIVGFLVLFSFQHLITPPGTFPHHTTPHFHEPQDALTPISVRSCPPPPFLRLPAPGTPDRCSTWDGPPPVHAATPPPTHSSTPTPTLVLPLPPPLWPDSVPRSVGRRAGSTRVWYWGEWTYSVGRRGGGRIPSLPLPLPFRGWGWARPAGRPYPGWETHIWTHPHFHRLFWVVYARNVPGKGKDRPPLWRPGQGRLGACIQKGCGVRWNGRGEGIPKKRRERGRRRGER